MSINKNIKNQCESTPYSFLPDIFQAKQLIAKINSEDDQLIRGSGVGWTQLQNMRYIEYLSENKRLFNLSLKERKSAGVHVQMSRYIKTRTSIQCRSHHQKMLIKFGTVEKIISSAQLVNNSSKNVQIKDVKMKDFIDVWENQENEDSVWHLNIQKEQHVDRYFE